jgi:cytochrome P450
VVAEALQAVMDSFTSRLFSVLRLPESFPTPANVRAWWAMRRLNRVIYDIIDQRRASGKKDDLLSILLHARDQDDGSGMTDKQLRDEAMTLFLAGHETTALALTYTLYLLARHPAVADELGRELDAVLGGRPVTAGDLPRLRFTEMVVTEAMRLYPPAYAIGRQAVEACELGGYRVPAGQTVLMMQWVVHRDKRFYDEPERFHPHRWDGDLHRRLPKYAYFPFGGGPRVCIGNTFAMVEAVLALGCLGRHWRMTWPSEAEVQLRPRITLGPAGPVEMVVHRR